MGEVAAALAPHVGEPIVQSIVSDVQREVMRCRVVGATPEDFFAAFFCDTSNFQQKTSAERGDRNFKCGPWARVPAGFHSRIRTFETPFKTPFGEIGSCQMRETQRVQSAGAAVLTVNTMQMKGVPYADYYEVHGIFVATADGPDLEITSLQAVTWLKHTWMKSKISNIAKDRASIGMQLWQENALPVLRELVAATGARAPTCPPFGALTPRPILGVEATSKVLEEVAWAAELAVATQQLPEPPAAGTPGSAAEATPELNLPALALPRGELRWSTAAGEESWWTLPAPSARREVGVNAGFQIVVVGAPGCGRSALLQSFGQWAALHRHDDETGLPPTSSTARVPGSFVRIRVHGQEVGVSMAEPPSARALPPSAKALRAHKVSELRRLAQATPGLADVELEKALDSSDPRTALAELLAAGPPPATGPVIGLLREHAAVQGALLVYDTTDRVSFHALCARPIPLALVVHSVAHAKISMGGRDDWARLVRADTAASVLVLVGTKTDLAVDGGRRVGLAEGERAAARLGARHHFEVSGESGFGVGQVHPPPPIPLLTPARTSTVVADHPTLSIR
jgi:hypothetical protein